MRNLKENLFIPRNILGELNAVALLVLRVSLILLIIKVMV